MSSLTDQRKQQAHYQALPELVRKLQLSDNSADRLATAVIEIVKARQAELQPELVALVRAVVQLSEEVAEDNRLRRQRIEDEQRQHDELTELLTDWPPSMRDVLAAVDPSKLLALVNSDSEKVRALMTMLADDDHSPDELYITHMQRPFSIH